MIEIVFRRMEYLWMTSNYILELDDFERNWKAISLRTFL
jgi:hypothetical protein